MTHDVTAVPDTVVWTGGLGLARATTDEGSLVVLRRDGDPAARVALVDGRSHADLPALLEAAAGDPARVTAGPALDAPDDTLLSPVGRPGKIVCVGRNYLDHVHEAGPGAGPAYPDLFPKWHTCLSGPYEDVPLPPESAQIDYESELAVVIGRRARRVAADDVADVVFGYTAANDGSVRDYQFHTGQRVAGKAWDRLTPLGPVVVPAAQLGGVRPDLAITGRYDGRLVQDARTDKLLFGVPELIAYITTVMTLEPGDVVLTGTPAGVGIVRTPPLWLRDGSEFEVRIEGIGALRNRYRTEQPS